MASSDYKKFNRKINFKISFIIEKNNKLKLITFKFIIYFK